MGIGTGTAGLMTSLNYYQNVSNDLIESLEEVAIGLITLQSQLDSLAAVVLQNRRGLDLLTADKGGLCFFLDKACYLKSATVSPSICHEVMGPDAMIFVF